MDIIRKIQDEFREYGSVFPAVGLVGPRQVGKTTFAKSLQEDGDIVYLDLESKGDREKLADPVFYFSQFPDKCVVLDEVQFMPEIFSELRGIIDADRRNGRFVLLGSASPELIRHSSESLAGRIGYLELTPFTISELGEDIRLHWLRGGFPLAYLAVSNRASLLWRQNFIKTYIQRDLGLLGLQADPQLIERFWYMLASYHGNIWNGESFARALGISRPTVNRYLDFMEGAFMVRVLRPWFTNNKKRLVKSPKVYIRDSGLLHSLIGLNTEDDLINNIQVGASWEGYVIEQISNCKPTDMNVWYYRTQQGAECDLLLERNGDIKAAIEVKLSSSPGLTKGFKIAMEDTGAAKAFVVAKVDTPYNLDPKTRVTSLENFLNNELKQL